MTSTLSGATHSSPAPMGRRERKKLETRRALERAALRLFLRKGYDETTIEDITDAVDVSPRTFFRYFSSKEEVAFGDTGPQIERLRELLDERPADERILAALLGALTALADEFETSQTDVQEMRYRLLRESPSLETRGHERFEHLADVVTTFVARRLDVDPTRDLRPSLVGVATASALRSAAEIATGDPDRNLVDTVLEAFALLQAGFGLDD